MSRLWLLARAASVWQRLIRPATLLACVGCALAGLPDRRHADAHYALAAADVAAKIAPVADAYMQVVLRGPQREYYSMLKPNAPERGTHDYQAVKSEELRLRNALQEMMPPEVTEWQLGYGDFWLFLERRYRTVAEENDWRNRSIGEMYLGKYQNVKYGQPLRRPVEKMAEVKHLDDGVRVVIPIVKQSRFVCFMSVTMRRSKR